MASVHTCGSVWSRNRDRNPPKKASRDLGVVKQWCDGRTEISLQFWPLLNNN